MPADVLLAVADHKSRADTYALYRDYEAGDHYYPYASEAFREKFRWVLEHARANKCPTVITNFTDRVSLAAWGGNGAKQADAIAEATGLRQVINLAVREAWQEGDAYILAWPGRDRTIKPWYHRADQAGFKLSEDDPGIADWFYKLWTTRDGYGRVNIYYDDRVERWVTTAKVHMTGAGSVAQWPDREHSYVPYQGPEGDGGPVITYASVGLESGLVPWVHIPRKPDTQGGHGTSILRDVVPLQDAMNHALTALVLGVEQYGSPLRALMNYQPTTYIDPQTGKPTEEALRFDETRNRIFGVKGPGPLQQLNPPDSTNLLQVLSWFSAEIANSVGVPVSDIEPDLGNIPSGTALRVLAARRTAAVVDFTETATPAISGLMRLLGAGDARPEWADPAPMDDTERLTVAQQKIDLGYPLAEVLPSLGEDPDDIERILGAILEEEANAAKVAAEAFRQGKDPAAAVTGEDPATVKLRMDTFTGGRRAGIDPKDSARIAGLPTDIKVTGQPITLRNENEE